MHNSHLVPRLQVALAAAAALFVVETLLGVAPPSVPAQAAAFAGGVAITEILANVPNETSDELVELLNVGTTTVDLAGWQLADNGATPQTIVAFPRTLTIGRSRTTVAPGKLALLLDKDYAGSYDTQLTGVLPDDVTLLSTSSGNPSLSNSADRVAVRDAAGVASDDYSWTSDPGEGGSTARRSATGGALTELVVDADGPSVGSVRAVPPPPPPAVAPEVQLSEVLPDPAGDDGTEYVEVVVAAAASLGELRLRDASGSTYALEGSAAGGSLLVLERSATGIALNNDGDTVTLVWQPDGQAEQVLDEISYSGGTEGQSYARFVGGWKWTTTPTRGTANVLTEPQAEVEVEDEDDNLEETAEETAGTPAVEVGSLAELRSLSEGELVRVSGSVTAEPGLFHASGFYVADDSGAALVVPASDLDKSWLEGVTVGNHGVFTGTVEQRASGVRLVLDELPELQSGDPLAAADVALDQVASSDVGRLVRVHGTVSRRSGKSFRIAENSAELLVSVRKSSGITKPAPKKGSPATVIGIVLAGSGESVVVAPRGSADLAGGSNQKGELAASGSPAYLPLLLALSLSSCAQVLRWRLGSIKK